MNSVGELASYEVINHFEMITCTEAIYHVLVRHCLAPLTKVCQLQVVRYLSISNTVLILIEPFMNNSLMSGTRAVGDNWYTTQHDGLQLDVFMM